MFAEIQILAWRFLPRRRSGQICLSALAARVEKRREFPPWGPPATAQEEERGGSIEREREMLQGSGTQTARVFLCNTLSLFLFNLFFGFFFCLFFCLCSLLE